MKLTACDPNQIIRQQYDEVNNASRVIIAGKSDLKFDIDAKSVTDAIVKGINDSTFGMTNIPQLQQVIQKIEYIDKPYPVIETKIEYVEKPVIVYETKTEYIDKPYKVIEYQELIKYIPVIETKIVPVKEEVFIEKIVDKMPAWGWALILIELAIIIIKGVAK